MVKLHKMHYSTFRVPLELFHLKVTFCAPEQKCTFCHKKALFCTRMNQFFEAKLPWMRFQSTLLSRVLLWVRNWALCHPNNQAQRTGIQQVRPGRRHTNMLIKRARINRAWKYISIQKCKIKKNISKTCNTKKPLSQPFFEISLP